MKGNNVTVPQPRQAVYATKITSPPELNTLVPEDFDMIDFNFVDLKSKNSVKETFIQTDDSFILPNISEVEEETEEKLDETKRNTSDESQVDSNKEQGIAIGVIAAAAVTTTEIISENDEPEKIAEAIPIVEAASVIDEPLKKVSEARKTIEAGTVPDPIILEEVSKSMTVNPESKAESNSSIVVSEVPEPEETKAAPIIIADISKLKPEVASEPVITKAPEMVQEITAPPPLPTDTEHLVAARESLKPSMLPVKPVNGAPTANLDNFRSISSSPLTKIGINSEELEKLNNELEKQKLALENEINSKIVLESQIQAMISKSNAQEEALRYKNESMEQLHDDFLRINNDLTAVKIEKERLEVSLAKAQEELLATNESNAHAYIEKSDEVSALKDRVAEFASIIGQKNKEIDSLQRQLEEIKRTNMRTALDNVQQYEKIEDELLKMVEEEILKMQDTIEEQREYNAKMQLEVDSEYTYWKRRLAKPDKKSN